MKCVAGTESPTQFKTFIQFVFKGDPLPPSVSKKEFSADLNSTIILREDGRKRFLVGLGPKEKIRPDHYRQAVGTAIRALQKIGVAEAVLECEKHEACFRQAAEGAVMAAYFFDTFLPADRKVNPRFSRLFFRVEKNDLARVRKEIEIGVAMGESANLTRSIGDMPGNYVCPETIADAARDLAAEFSTIKAKVLDEKILSEGGFGGMMAVGGGSQHPPRMIILEYRGGKQSDKPSLLVGKAITFDSGGISIKPGDRMDEMKYDKMGGCAVLGIMRGAALIGLKRNLVGIIAAAENMPSAQAYRPGDIVTAYNGYTIEVLNTDAEGRIVLADALAYAAINYKPAEIIDYATLTGAVIGALGTTRAGLFTNDAIMSGNLTVAGEKTGEKVWALPHDEPFHEAIKSDIAMVKNIGPKGDAGASTAAAFLEKWIPDGVPWAHLDIAGTAWSTKDASYMSKGATGYGVRLTLEYLMRS